MEQLINLSFFPRMVSVFVNCLGMPQKTLETQRPLQATSVKHRVELTKKLLDAATPPVAKGCSCVHCSGSDTSSDTDIPLMFSDDAAHSEGSAEEQDTNHTNKKMPREVMAEVAKNGMLGQCGAAQSENSAADLDTNYTGRDEKIT